MLPKFVYDRLWGNQWTAGGDDGLEEHYILSAIKLGGPTLAQKPGYLYLISADLSVSQDFSAACVLGVNMYTGEVKLASMKHWEPTDGNPIDFAEVEKCILRWREQYNVRRIIFDNREAAAMAQRVKRHGVTVDLFYSSQSRKHEMAMAIWSRFMGGTISLYAYEQLLLDLRRISFVERGDQVMLEADRQKGGGHCDTAICLAIGLLFAVQ